MARDTVPLVLQRTPNECALACLAMMADWYGLGHSLEYLRRLHTPDDTGTTLNELMRVADGIGFRSSSLWCLPNELDQVGRPSILHWKYGHYVTLWASGLSYGSITYLLSDPARGVQRIGRGELAMYYSGVLVNVTG